MKDIQAIKRFKTWIRYCLETEPAIFKVFVHFEHMYTDKLSKLMDMID